MFCIVEVSEPGFEANANSLITTANNATLPLSFFPDLNSQEGLASDTAEVGRQFAFLIVLTEVINLSSLLALPMLPRQEEETRELVKKGEESSTWATFTLVPGGRLQDLKEYGCYKVLGGSGWSEDESNVSLGLRFLHWYGLNFYFTFWSILSGREKFSFSMFF